MYQSIYKQSLNMEKKVLKGITVWLSIFTVVACVCLMAMPWMKEQMILAAENIRNEETVVRLEQETQKDQGELKIEIPDEIDGKNITVTNDLVHKTIYVRFAGYSEDYAKKYSVRGSSDNITGLSYYREGENGILEISLDRSCEMSYSYEAGHLCMKLIDPHDIYDKIVVIDAGHGGTQPGAVKRNIIEKDINLAIVQALKEIVDAESDESIGVYYTRLDDSHVELADRADLANNLEADLFISIHNNASHSGRFNDENGTLVMYSPKEGDMHNSEHLSRICLENVCEAAGSKNLGLLSADNIYIIRSSKVPVALIEVGYMTNHEELDKLITPEYQKRVAQGVYNAIKEAFEEGF